MTTKDLRLKYRLENKSYPFDEHFQIWIDENAQDPIKAYITYLEDNLLKALDNAEINTINL